MARRERRVRPNFNASGWADAVEIILGAALIIGVLAFALTRN